MRRFIVLLACIFLTVGVAGQATATPSGRRSAPSAPTAVAVSPAAGLSATVSWKAPSSSGSSRVLGYTITTKADNKRYPTVAVAPWNSQSKVIKNLVAGINYTISVTAWNSAGRSPAATVKYTVPVSTGQFAFTVDTTAKAIVKIPVTGGPAVTVAAVGTTAVRFAVDKTGNTYLLNTATKKVTTVSAAGSSTTVRSGLTAPVDIQLDAAGRIYVLDGSKVIRLAAAGSPEKVVSQSPAGFDTIAMFVAADGTVNLLSSQDFEVSLLTVSPAGAATIRSIGAGYEGGRFLRMIGDQVGTLYFNVGSGGGSGYVGWYKLPAGSSSLVDATTEFAEYAAAVGPDNGFYLFPSAKWCVGMSEHIPDENGNLCVPDRSVPEVLKTAPDGSSTRVPLQGFTLDGLDSVTVDAAGTIYVVRSANPNAGVLKYPPTGGAPVVLATGTFSQVATNG